MKFLKKTSCLETIYSKEYFKGVYYEVTISVLYIHLLLHLLNRYKIGEECRSLNDKLNFVIKIEHYDKLKSLKLKEEIEKINGVCKVKMVITE